VYPHHANRCPFANQFFSNDEGGCKDATVCGIRQAVTAELGNTTDRVCVDLQVLRTRLAQKPRSNRLLQECSFYETEVIGSGLQTECLPNKHASHSAEVAMMSVASTTGIIACLVQLFLST